MGRGQLLFKGEKKKKSKKKSKTIDAKPSPPGTSSANSTTVGSSALSAGNTNSNVQICHQIGRSQDPAPHIPDGHTFSWGK